MIVDLDVSHEEAEELRFFSSPKKKLGVSGRYFGARRSNMLMSLFNIKSVLEADCDSAFPPKIFDPAVGISDFPAGGNSVQENASHQAPPGILRADVLSQADPTATVLKAFLCPS